MPQCKGGIRAIGDDALPNSLRTVKPTSQMIKLIQMIGTLTEPFHRTGNDNEIKFSCAYYFGVYAIPQNCIVHSNTFHLPRSSRQ